MIYFRKENTKLILIYQPDEGGSIDWVHDKLKLNGHHFLKNTFYLKEKNLSIVDEFDEIGLEHNREEYISFDEDFDSFGSIAFVVGEKEDDYYKLDQGILQTAHNVFIDKDIIIDSSYFVAQKNISIFRIIDGLVNEDIYIGGNKEHSFSEMEFIRLIQKFPNSYEVERYRKARVSSILRDYFETAVDAESKYIKYMNRKVSRKGVNPLVLLKESELNKYLLIQEKLKEMLENEISYSEPQWQAEILQIIRLIFPKYIYVFKEVSLSDIYSGKSKRLDYLLIDSGGYADIVEIKKPFDKCIMTSTQYRDNHIPLKELSGTVMQIEKYIYCLNKWGRDGERVLTEKYKNELPNNFEIRITNPNGIVIMGRDRNLTKEQIQDFEIVKRKYKNIVDIITYDDLLRRLEFTISQYQK